MRLIASRDGSTVGKIAAKESDSMLTPCSFLDTAICVLLGSTKSNQSRDLYIRGGRNTTASLSMPTLDLPAGLSPNLKVPNQKCVFCFMLFVFSDIQARIVLFLGPSPRSALRRTGPRPGVCFAFGRKVHTVAFSGDGSQAREQMLVEP